MLTEFTLVAVQASIKAGKEILNVYNSKDFETFQKDDNSPLTTADLASNRAIIESLNEMKIPVLSEEGKDIPYAERKDWKQFWLIDPLDGTKEFIKRNGEFTVNIALIEEQEPVLGVVYVPVLDHLYFACHGQGAYMLKGAEKIMDSFNNMDELISQSDKLPKTSSELFTVVASKSHLSDETRTFINDLKRAHPDLMSVSKGSSLKLCLVAEGKADVYPRLGPTMEWDTAAAHAIVTESGGEVVRFDDRSKMKYNKENLLNPYFICYRYERYDAQW
jgi:3'(2'), 5'-bisphosphate nucleotidase